MEEAYRQSAQETLRSLRVERHQGLSQSEAARRLVRAGANKLPITGQFTVIRDGKKIPVDAYYLVPGDVVVIQTGEVVPADGRLIAATGLKVDETVLTGQSSSAPKETRPLTRAAAIADRRNMVFAGTTVTAGSGTAVVTATGAKTHFNAITRLQQENRQPSRPATVVCTSLTGALTGGVMHAGDFNCLQGDVLSNRQPQQPLQRLAYIGMALTSLDSHSPTEQAVLAFAQAVDGSAVALRNTWRLRDTIAFDPRWKYRAVLTDHPTQPTQTLFVLGAPEVLLEKSSQALNEHSEATHITSQHRVTLQHTIEALAAEGKRLLAIGVRRHLRQIDLNQRDVTDLLFLGVISLTDPVAPDAAAAVKQATDNGVMIKILTGEHLATAQTIARQVGLPANADTVLTGHTLEAMSDQELSDIIDRITIFARIEPLDKQRVVRLLQAKGHHVAMSGDAIHDAVALRIADKSYAGLWD